ncbi:hypothetical protein [Haladaptatus halobius]|uniref:hypothetical protein n=1 Tax=Haladaptatus halobius TaxID=2884875 RepID=UPI001D0AD5FB|nr:hypothetical protein [Haladaptatus halobius]
MRSISNTTVHLLRALAKARASAPWARSERALSEVNQTSTRAVPVGASGQRS